MILCASVIICIRSVPLEQKPGSIFVVLVPYTPPGPENVANGQVDGWLDGWMNGWMDEGMDRQTDGCGWVDELWIGGWMNRWMDEGMDMGEWMGGWTG